MNTNNSNNFIDEKYITAYKQVEEELLKIEEDKKKWKKQLKGLINVTSLFDDLNELSDWQPLGIVEIFYCEDANNSKSQFVRIKDDVDKLRYVVQSENEIKGIDHCCIWQRGGMLEDDYSGYILYPLKNGFYFKVEFFS